MSSAEAVGSMVMLAGGLLVAAALLFCAAWAAGQYAWKLWGSLSTIYKLQTMQYWFRRMSDDGTHALSKDYEEKKERKP